MSRSLRHSAAVAPVLGLVSLLAPSAAHAEAKAPAPTSHRCSATANIVNDSDALDGVKRGNAAVGGLSDMAWDARSHAWVSSVDNNGDDPARLWFYSNILKPRVVREPLVLKHSDGTPYNGHTGDFEGLAVLPNGDYAISSEVEPSVRIFGRNGVEKAHLQVPARFGVTGKSPKGEATANATFEGLTLSPDGRTLVVAMEGPLSGDTSKADATEHRFLVYGKRGSAWTLTKQIAYRTEKGNRVPEIAFYGRNNVVVEEAAFSKTSGNTVQLFAVTHLEEAKDVSKATNLSTTPTAAVHKTLVADVNACPSLGAKARPDAKQTNPLMDNYEGMAVTLPGRSDWYLVSLVSDNNFNSKLQTTRVLNLSVRLPR